jgi:3',5'-cyclic AMP phosphodiesterase CpdA
MALRVLHLSDIHFSTKFDEEKIVHEDVRDQLLNDLRDEVVPKSGKIDKVLIAGDVAFSGSRTEYEDVARWLEQVTSLCGCKPTDVLAVPGNHDARTLDRRVHRLGKIPGKIYPSSHKPVFRQCGATKRREQSLSTPML